MKNHVVNLQHLQVNTYQNLLVEKHNSHFLKNKPIDIPWQDTNSFIVRDDVNRIEAVLETRVPLALAVQKL